MNCPLCNSHMDAFTDPGDPQNGYAGGDESFQCSSDRCELGGGRYTESEVWAAIRARRGDAA